MTRVLVLMAMFAATAIAQTQAPVTYSEDWQSYGKSKKPQGWIDGKVGDLNAKPRGYYKTAYDPLGDKKGPNVVFGSHKSTGSEDDEKNGKRIGWFSTYADKTFSAAGRHEFLGRLIELKKEARIGLVVLSGYPQKDSYYLIVDRRNAQGNLTMQLTAFGAGTPTGTVDSNFVIEQAKWYRFRISVDDVNNVTNIRARFWRDGTAEPSTYQIDATDASPNRLKSGHIGMWAGGGKDNDDGKSDDDDIHGKGVYIDDLSARSPSDTTPPVISFYESGTKLDPATTPAFNRDARIEIRITDDLSTFTSTATLDGAQYTSQTPVSAQGLHTLIVRAVDAPGNAREATLRFIVDKTAPVITLLADGNPLVNGTVFDKDVTVSANVQDISPVTTTSTLNNATVTLPAPVAQEQAHQLSVTAVDAATNSATANGTFTIDKSAPVITIQANGADLASGASFRTNVTLTWTVTDLTLNTVTAMLGTTAVQSGVVVTTEGEHTLVITATDRANHSKSETRKFYVAKNAPEVTLLANGAAFIQDKTYNSAVHFTVQVRDPTPTTTVVTVDSNPYTQGTPVTGDGLHNVKVVVTNVADLSTTVGPFNFSIDTALPTITMTESGQPFQDGMKFTRDVTPIVAATDALTANPKIVVNFDGRVYPTNTIITEEKAEHLISATATDDGGNVASIGPFRFMLDKTPPIVTIVDAVTGLPFPADSITNQPVRVLVKVVDITRTTSVATLNGNSFDLGTPSSQPDGSVIYTPAPISAEGNYTISVVATDEVSLSNAAVTAAFVIDTTPPTLTFTDPAPGGTVVTLSVTVGGTFDDAQTITIGGREAAVNQASKTFTINDVALLEGRNEIPAVATDRAGNRSTPTHVVNLDTRAPELTITAPPANVCVDTATLQITGTVSDQRIDTLMVTVGSAAPVPATIDATNGTWSVSVAVDEGKKLITVQAIDKDQHATSVSRQIVVDRTPPVIEIRNAGEAFNASTINRPVAFSIRATDADPNVVVTAKLDNNPYSPLTPVGTEGQHTLVVTATDCANHSETRSIEFTIDLTPPTIRNLNPANATTVGTMPTSLSGLTDTDAASVEIAVPDLRVQPAADGTFTIPTVPFAEGLNRFTLIARDRAGNSSSFDYSVTVKTTAPVVEIRESGAPIENGALFNRAITPVIRSVDAQATIAATLNGATYSSGTTISNDGDYTLRATATDSFGHTGTAEATFTIDRTPPVVKITTPQTGTIQSDQVEVRGTAGDSISANVNGHTVTLTGDGSFTVPSLLLDVGTNPIIAVGRDRAGNTGRDEVLVTRDDLGAAILLTYPPDRSMTNRTTTDVAGRVITPGKGTVVVVGSTTVAVDSTGAFRVSGYTLTEGENTITATSTAANAVQSSASTRVTADFTPPTLTILESGQPLTDGVRFAERAVISLQSADPGGSPVTTELTIDGSKVAGASFTILTAGGHSVTALARDLAGNETRAERTLFIGATSAQCALDSFDPADGSIVLSNKTELVGRSGGAIGVKVNGVAALVADGAFCASVELPVEGANRVDIICTDANGSQTGTTKTITLVRVTGDPSITIDSPLEGFVTAQETMAVQGTVGAGVINADVNGVAVTITGNDSNVPRPFSVTGVRLAGGLNTLVAHGRNAGGRVATASRRGLYLKDAPAINISSPSSGTTTGVPRVTVSGTYSSLDPTTIVVSNLTTPSQRTAAFSRWTDTTGSFNAVDVDLGSGPQTLRVSGRDRLNREASATVVVTLVAGAPSITITQPANHALFGGSNDSVTVSGTFQAAPGSTVDVNGVTATLNVPSYSASVNFSTAAGGITPIVARVTEPGGASASATAIVTKIADAPTVVESFPAANAVEVDNGSLLLVLLSQPMDVASVNTAFRLEEQNGAPVSGSLYLDKEVLTFAPAALLTKGARYTLRVSTSAKNLAATALAAEYVSSFTVASSAPTTPPTVTPLGSAVCGQAVTVNGTASPGARLRLQSGSLILNATADAAGAFAFSFPLSGQSGYAVIRVQTVGSDGSVSPAAELKVRIDCSGPSVLNAIYERPVNRLTITFSERIDAASATVGSGNAVLLTLDDGRVVGGTSTTDQRVVTITPAEDLSAKVFTLGVTTAVKDLIGNRLVTPYSQRFELGGDQPVAGDGSGFISGEVYDATTGRPLGGVSISIDVATPTPVTTSTDARGRYLARLREGAHTIKAAHGGYASVWREIVVPAGAGVIPIDMRLTRRDVVRTSDGSAISLIHGGDTTITKRVDLTIPAGAVASPHKVSLTSIGGQALTGLLPLGWSPIASAEVAIDDSDAVTPLSGGQLVFTVPAAAITAATQNLAAVQYNAARDEWQVLVAVVNVASDGKVSVPISSTGSYALVYADKATGLTAPPLAVSGDVLRGVPAAAPDAPALVKRDFQLDPPVVLPTGRTAATLRIEGGVAKFPSGTAVQAYIDEELRLADGSRLLDPPFATDLLLYRTLAGDLGVADFHLAPSPRAAEVILEVGVDHIRVFPYPGRLDRGTLIGSEGGRVPADDKVTVDIASGAVPEPLRATATSLTDSDLNAVGAIAGFRVIGGFQLSLQRATQPAPVDLDGDGNADPIPPLELFVPARATFTVEASKLPAPAAQVILAELLDQTPFGRMVRLAVPMMLVDPSQSGTTARRFTTKSIDRSVLAVDGVVHEGRYVLLAAESPIAFATGTVRFGAANGRLVGDARVLAPPLGVAELSRGTGIYNIPVPAKPAGPFTLVPRHTTTGEGAAYAHSAAVDPDTVTRVDFALVAQPPVLGSVVVLRGDPPSQGTLSTAAITRDVAVTTNIRASFSPAIDPTSVTADSIVVTDSATGAKVNGRAAADGSVAVVWTLVAGELLKPNGRYIVSISPSIRGANGATLAHGGTFTFATVTQILNTEVRRERIRITIPDASGVSRIIGEPGALPAGWQAVAVRRGRDFVIRYQATAAGDGSFSFLIGNENAADKITIGDLIDLRVVSNIGNLAAIFALTPFASEDGKSFVVPAGAAIRYTTPEGITLDVPAGAFDVPTVIAVTAAKKEDFLDIPSLEAENNYATSVRVDFEGVSKKPLRVEAPVPPGFDTAGRQFIFAEKGMSSLGPRLAVLDLVKVVNGKFVTDHESTDQSAIVIGDSALKTGVTRTLTGSSFSKYLQMLLRSGIFMILDIKVPVGGAVGWAAMEGLQHSYDLMWTIFASYYIPHIHVAERGGALLPIVTGQRFTVTGIDPGTGLQAFSRTYDPIPFGEPGTVTPVPAAQQNDGGPYPVFGGPFRVEMMHLDVEEVDVKSIRNFIVRLDNNNVQVSPGDPALDADVKIQLLNVSKGTVVSGKAGGTLTLSAELGNRIVLLIEEHDVDSKSPISIVFNEPIYVGESNDPDIVDIALHELIKVAHAPGAGGGPPIFSDITPQVKFTTDSGQRRVNIELPSALQSEAFYRITLNGDISDIEGDGPGLTLGQGTIETDGVLTPVGGGTALQLYFDVRKPAGLLGSFVGAPVGWIRGMDLSGNILFLAASDGGLVAYDMSNAADVGGGSPSRMGLVPGTSNGGAVSHIAVTVDRHNRVYTTAQAPASGLFMSYRVEDFLLGGSQIPLKGSKLINWRLGFSSSLGLPSNTLLSDVPESIPFRIKVLLQDDETNYRNREEFVAGTGAGQTGNWPDDDLKKFTVAIPGGGPYKTQRITVENVSMDMRWSGDAQDGGAALIKDVVARSTDKMRVIRNNRTYAVVAHLGYGIGIYDANAIESNRAAGLYTGAPGRLREQMVLTAGLIRKFPPCPNPTPDFGIIENYLTTDAELRGDPSGDIYAYFVHTFRGLLDLQLQLPGDDGLGTRDDDCEQRPSPNTGGLLLQGGNEPPRISAFKGAFTGAAGRPPFGHFNQLARFHWSVTAAENRWGQRGTTPDESAERDYLIVAGHEYGLIFIDIDSDPIAVDLYPLQDENIADIVWIPGGAVTVRVYQSANIAVVSDRVGRVYVVDISRIDERWDEEGNPISGLFPTVAKALGSPGTGGGIGADDPRILWKSEPGVASGSVAPVFDPYTGILYAGGGQQVQVLAAVDPRVLMRVNLGEADGLSNVGGIVPLGISPPQNILNRINALPACDGTTMACKENASLGAFQLEVALPGNMVDSLVMSNNELQIAVESERVAGAITEQTPGGFPRAHLRRTRRDGSQDFAEQIAGNFKFKRIVPNELRPALRNQRGYNRFISPWIVAIADPRASEKYDWKDASTKQQKKEAGCEECERPQHLKGKTEIDGIYELYTNGRFITVRPELKGFSSSIFENTDYSYLGRQNRLLARFSTIMADTVRPTETLVAAQNPPVASGALQQTTYLHSGELETNTVDLDAGGRADFNVLLDRTYRSRTIGGSVFGQGWDSSLLKRLRALPNGDVEYRDGSEVWRFRLHPALGYISPKGFFLKLTRTARGWKLIDQSWSIAEFDDLGRLLSESDEFFDPQNPNSGNVIRYVYDESGRLSQIIDPVKRVSTLKYWSESEAGASGAYPGMVKQIVDWRDRKLDYVYDTGAGTLLRVQLPEVANTSGGRPTVEYRYTPVGGSFSDKLELRPNLEAIVDPHQVAGGGTARVRFTYDTGGGFRRDHVLQQMWGTGEQASFDYESPTSASTTDILGQVRTYEMTEQPKDYFQDRAHVKTQVEKNIATSSAPFGQLPTTIAVGIPPTTSADRTTTFEHDDEGQVTTETVAGVRSVTHGYINVQPAAPGFVPGSSSITPQGGPSSPVALGMNYQSGPNRSTFLQSVSANGVKIDTPEPSRNYRDVLSSDDNITQTDTFDMSGQETKAVSSGGTDSGGGGGNTEIQWAGIDAPEHARGRVTKISDGGLATEINYPSAEQSIQTDGRGVVTTTQLDAWQRPVHVKVVGPDMTIDERFEYDATGRLIKHIRKQGSADVTRTYAYDLIGRPTSLTTDNVADAGSITSSVAYDLVGRRIVTNNPGGSVTTVSLDTLGRVASRITTTGGTPITDYFAYDLDDNVVFTTDLLTATADAYDAHGNLFGTMTADGTSTVATIDAWGNPTTIKVTAGGSVVADSTLSYTPTGRLRSANAKLDGSRTRQTSVAWDGGGRTTGVGVSGRATHAKFDPADRLELVEEGTGTVTAVTTTFDGAVISGHDGALPQSGTRREKGSDAYELAMQYNAAADVISQSLGNLEWQQSYDQDGNVTSASSPNRPARGFQYDSRGALKVETLPGGGINKYTYHPTGALTSYTDPANEVTGSTNDLIGRPTRRNYRDGTHESIEWEGRRVKSITDRQGRVQNFIYNVKGQISEITGLSGSLDKIEYDEAGRVIKWTTPDSAIEYGEFDLEGRPGKTVQSRLRDGNVIDKYTQQHTWNEHGERITWTMPTYSGFTSSKPWTASVSQQYDAMGNITRIERTLQGTQSGSILLNADYRNARRPNERTLTTAGGETIKREYGYDSANGLVNKMAAIVKGKTIAGSIVTYDGLQKSSARLLGVSGGSRSDEWSYDSRSRLESSLLARDAGSTPQTEGLTTGDFRDSLDRVSLTPADPPSVHFQEDPSGGHKISVMQRGLLVEEFKFNGGERREDGRFTYQYDGKGRLAVATLKTGTAVILPRRVKYFYDGNDRLVGRRLEYVNFVPATSPMEADWRLEDRPDILAGEGLPPDSTFVWDPIDDQLVAIFKAGSSESLNIDPNGGLVRQMIHGGLRYDDPLEIALADSTVSSGVSRLYPIYDEAGAKSLQIILNERAEIVSRSVAAGPYGEDQAILIGPAVDKVKVTAKKDAAGNLISIDISIRGTEEIAQASVASGFRLAAVNATGGVVKASTTTAALADEATAQWSLTGAQWNDLTAGGGAALSIGTTSGARGQAWGSTTQFLAAPSWAVETKGIHTSASLPVEVRESLAGLSQWLASIPAGEESTKTLYEVQSLYALGKPRVTSGVVDFAAGDPQVLIVSAGFHAQPFQDPFTGKNYVRARWFDPQSATWLTPDPRGYRDSSNLYAYCGNDPVNCSDPTGLEADDDDGDEDGWDAAWALAKAAGKTFATTVVVTVAVTAAVVITGVSAPVIITVGAVAVAGGAAYNGYQRYQAGHADSVLEAAAMGLGDVTGINTAIEAATCEEMGTDRQLSMTECAEKWGTVIGLVAGGGVGKRVAKGTVPRARQVREGITRSVREGLSVRPPPANVAARRVARPRKQKPIVLGETMKYRVKPVAKKIGAKTYKPRDPSHPASIERQKRWIRRQIASGREIYDIGKHRGRPIDPKTGKKRSDFYIEEVRALKGAGYHREFVKWVTAEVPDQFGNMVKKNFRLYRWVQ